MRQLIHTNLDSGNDWLASFGAETMKSGKACQIHVFAGQFHVVQLTPAQAGKLLSGPGAISVLSGKRGYKVEAPQITLKSVRIDNSSKFDPARKITGEVSYKIVGKLPSKVSLRLSYRMGTSASSSFHHLDATPDEKEGKIRFSFSPLAGDDDKTKLKAGPLVVFVDLCTVTMLDVDPYVEVKVLSNSTPVLLDVTPSDSIDLVGTKWQFNGTETTITFLKGGKFEWNGKPETGSWKKDGKSLTIDVNGFTLFELTLEGADTMTGTWKRLKGKDAGIKNPSGMRRVRESR